MRKFMYVFCFAVYVASFMVGCSAVKQSYSALEACKRDSVCYAQMEKGRDLSSSIATAAVASIPNAAPAAPIVGSSIGMLVSLLIGVYLGKKKEK